MMRRSRFTLWKNGIWCNLSYLSSLPYSTLFLFLLLSLTWTIIDGVGSVTPNSKNQSLQLQNQTKMEVPLRSMCDNVTTVCYGEFVDCRRGFCQCQEGYAPRQDNTDLCGERVYYNVNIETDPTMIGVVIGLILMSITLCVVLRLFAKARFRENRTIFNTPNPRLMNVSLMKNSKAFFRGNSASASRRRGSQASVNSCSPRDENDESPENESMAMSPKDEQEPRSRIVDDEISSRPGRPKGLRQQMSIETTGSGNIGGPMSSSTATTADSGGGPTTSGVRIPKSKYRQDSILSNSMV